MADDVITIFISYAHEDAKLARSIQQRLEADGFTVWIDEGALRAGDSLIQSIATAIHEMEFVVALITAASVDSRWCQHEIRLAMTSGLNREGVKVLPVRVGEAPIPGELEDTYCAPLDPSDLDAGLGRLVDDARSHHEERRKAKAAGEPLPTTGFDPAVGSGAFLHTAGAAMEGFVERAAPAPTYEPIKIVGIVREGVGQPRNDGTAGSGLYKVPLRLSRRPSTEWAQLFVQAWDHPPEFTTMHRPGIARVSGDTVILDGTTMDELERYHAKTLRLCVEAANKKEQDYRERLRQAQEREEAERRQHEQEVNEVADRLRFDDGADG